MKKLAAILITMAIASTVFAQVAISVSGSGKITLIDEGGNAVFVRDGSGYDLMTFKAASEKEDFGFSATLNDFLLDYVGYVAAGADPEVAEVTPFTAFRDWNFWAKSEYVKVILGKVRNGDFRTVFPYGYLGNYLGVTDRFFGGAAYGIVVESTSLGPLTLGLGLPVPETAAPALDGFKQANIGANYAIEGMGTLSSLIRLDLVANSNVINLGFDYSGVKNLLLAALFQATLASSNVFAFGLGAEYALDALTISVEFDGKYDTALAWELYLQAAYKLLENVKATVGGDYRSDATYDAFAKIGYDPVSGVTFEAKGGYKSKLYYQANVVYTFSF